MRNNLCSQFKYVAAITLPILHGISVAASASATCYSTPRSAIDALQTSPSVSLASESNGYRITSIQSDPVLGDRWAMIANCSHPEWPVFALRADGENLPKTPHEKERSLAEDVKAVPLVRIGDIVLLWRQEKFLRIEVAGVSEESGDLGKTIRVRLLHRNTDDQSISQQFFGVVRGPSYVEIQR